MNEVKVSGNREAQGMKIMNFFQGASRQGEQGAKMREKRRGHNFLNLISRGALALRNFQNKQSRKAQVVKEVKV